MVQHGNGITTVYSHGQKGINRKRGKEVTARRTNYGGWLNRKSTGPHCHFEVRIDGKNY